METSPPRHPFTRTVVPGKKVLKGRLLVIINPEKLLSPQEESLLPHQGTTG